MNPVPDIYRILPEVVLTLTGVAVMMLDASLKPATPRRPLGWVAAVGTTIALWASLWQLSLPQGPGFFGTVETSAFTIFFHVLICGIVLVSLLLSLDTLPEDSHHQGEFYALMVFGAVGMCLMTGAVELLVVFVALEISSIATYVLAGYRKQTGRGPEAAFAIAEENGDVGRLVVRNHHVGVAIPVHVRNRNIIGQMPCANGRARCLPEMSRAIAQQHADCFAVGIRNQDVEVAVTIHVGDGNPPRSPADGDGSLPKSMRGKRRVSRCQSQGQKRQSESDRFHINPPANQPRI